MHYSFIPRRMSFDTHCNVLTWSLLISCVTISTTAASTINLMHQAICCATDNSYFSFFEDTKCMTLITTGIQLNDQDISTHAIQCIQQQLHIPTRVWTLQTNSCAANPMTLPSGDAVMMIMKYDLFMSTLTIQLEVCIQQWNPRTQFMFLLLHTGNLQKNGILTIFEKMWQQYNILHAVILPIKVKDMIINASNMWTYNPFNSHLYNENVMNSTIINLQNLNGLPLKVSLFGHYPTLYLLQDSNIKKKRPLLSITDGQNLTSYHGVDGRMFATMVHFMNFTPQIINPPHQGAYGFPLPNGTFTGALGDIIYRRADISLNSRFLKYYNSTDIEFSKSLLSDKMCIIVPKARPIPRWRRMLLSFNSELWLILLGTFILLASFQLILRWCHKSQKLHWYVIFETLQVFLLTALHRPPKAISERCFYASCLMFCLVVMNAFQGLLVTNITYPTYLPDIHTLAELDRSNLPIWTHSPENKDVFKDMGTPVMERLLHKFDIFNGSGIDLLNHVANLTDAAVIIRETSALYTESIYVAQDGTQLIHTVEECPAYYHLAYIVPKGSPYLSLINNVILRMNEAGLTFKWHSEGIDARSLLGSCHNQKCARKEANRVFSLTDLQLAFYILVTGLILSIVVFVMEVTRHQARGQLRGKMARQNVAKRHP